MTWNDFFIGTGILTIIYYIVIAIHHFFFVVSNPDDQDNLYSENYSHDPTLEDAPVLVTGEMLEPTRLDAAGGGGTAIAQKADHSFTDQTTDQVIEIAQKSTEEEPIDYAELQASLKEVKANPKSTIAEYFNKKKLTA